MTETSLSHGLEHFWFSPSNVWKLHTCQRWCHFLSTERCYFSYCIWTDKVEGSLSRQKAHGQYISKLWGAIKLEGVSLYYNWFLIKNNTQIIGFCCASLWQSIRHDKLVVQKCHKVSILCYYVFWKQHHSVFFILSRFWVLCSATALQSLFCSWCLLIWPWNIHLIPAVLSILILLT